MGLHNVAAEQASMRTTEQDRQARILQTLLRVLTGVTGAMYLDLFFTDVPVAVFVVATLALLIELGAWQLLRRGRVRAGSWVLVTGLWLLLTAGMFVADMRGNVPWIGITLIVLTAGLLLGSRTGILFASLTTATGLIYLIAYTNQSLLQTPLLLFNPTAIWIILSAVCFAGAGLIRLTNSSVGEALAEARRQADAQAQSNRELESIRQSLETQVKERTLDLQSRTQYLQAAIEVSRATASILDADRLMQNAVELIHDQFELYYTGLFLVEPGGDWAMLKAGTGEAGQRMLARGHRIRVGSGMVGWSVANAQPRIALDVGRDAVRLATAELPETRSEAAIPLRSRGKVLGALTVQSSRPAAFGEMEIATFQSLGDQLAIALDNARLLSESRHALDEAQRAQGQISRRAWQEFLRSTGSQNVKYSFGQVETQVSSGDAAVQAARQQVLATGRPVQVQTAGDSASTAGALRTALLLPISVRDQVVGVIRFTKEPGAGSQNNGTTGPAAWHTDEIELLETITGQLGVALDSARLYQDTQRHAFREQLAGEMTARIRQTLDVQAVMRTAVEEIQRSLNLPEVMISLSPPEE